MITQGIDPQQINRRVRQIKTRMPGLLSQWGLVPKFKRWRLTQDPDSGMVVLFGVAGGLLTLHEKHLHQRPLSA